MAALCGHFAVTGSTLDVHTAVQNPVGTRAFDAAGNEYIYAKGIGSTVLGSWVTFDELLLTTLLDSDSVVAQGRVGIAQAATVASTWGWYQIYGTGSGLCLASFADDGIVYQSATAGSVDDAEVTSAISLVKGAFGRSARSTSTGLATFELNYPFVDIGVID